MESIAFSEAFFTYHDAKLSYQLSLPMTVESLPLLQISTGDVMGDIHAAELVKALYDVAAESDIDLQIVALGGKQVQAAGAQLLGNVHS